MRVIAAALMLLLTMAVPSLAQKAGVGAWENSTYTMLNWIERAPELGWYYNWRTDQMYEQSTVRRTVEFVPMVHGRKDVEKPFRSKLPMRALLGFNEPDGKSGSHQANMSVEEAVRLWPKLERHGLRLGSPATTMGQTLGKNSWQRRFMDQVEARGLRVDFMAVHYYSKDGSVVAFRNWLHAVHAEYKRPIWVTEFAHVDWTRPGRATYQKNAQFLEEAIAMMESLPFVERHAWFAANPYPWGETTPRINLVSDDLKPTPVGQAFSRTLARIGDSRVAEVSN